MNDDLKESLMKKNFQRKTPDIFDNQVPQNGMIVWCITNKTGQLRYYTESSQNSKDFNELIEAYLEKLNQIIILDKIEIIGTYTVIWRLLTQAKTQR